MLMRVQFLGIAIMMMVQSVTSLIPLKMMILVFQYIITSSTINCSQ